MGAFSSIQPFSAIIGAAITAAVSFLIAYFLVAKRRKLKFIIADAEDLTSYLRAPGRTIDFSVDGHSFRQMHRSMIGIQNVGNINIEKFSFEVEIPGEHKGHFANFMTDSRHFAETVKISTDQATINPRLKVNVDGFLNPQEGFTVAVFFDGDDVRCKVYCRIPDAQVYIERGLFDFRPLRFTDIQSRLILELRAKLFGEK
jgi:hypothetical protein